MKTFLPAFLTTAVAGCVAEPTVTQQRMPGGLSVVTITSAHDRHRIVREVETGTAAFGNAIIESPKEVGGWLELKSTAPLPGSEGDGISDACEGCQGFNPGNPSNGATNANHDRCTNLEEFFNATNLRV